MKEYIEREAAIEVCSNQYKECLRKSDWCGDTVAWNICYGIKAIPAADVVERKRGEWIKVGESCGVDLLECPVCHTIHAQDGDAFCRDCGADMRDQQ